jgi:outer membrane receptor protein involved in Fe transport
LQAGRRAVKTTTRIENIFNRTYYDGTSLMGYRLPGATVVSGLAYTF